MRLLGWPRPLLQTSGQIFPKVLLTISRGANTALVAVFCLRSCFRISTQLNRPSVSLPACWEAITHAHNGFRA
jgi:hypothetical protein